MLSSKNRIPLTHIRLIMNDLEYSNSDVSFRNHVSIALLSILIGLFADQGVTAFGWNFVLNLVNHWLLVITRNGHCSSSRDYALPVSCNLASESWQFLWCLFSGIVADFKLNDTSKMATNILSVVQTITGSYPNSSYNFRSISWYVWYFAIKFGKNLQWLTCLDSSSIRSHHFSMAYIFLY
jgi:hypothetical protein